MEIKKLKEEPSEKISSLQNMSDCNQQSLKSVKDDTISNISNTFDSQHVDINSEFVIKSEEDETSPRFLKNSSCLPSNDSPQSPYELCPIVELSEGHEDINTSIKDLHKILKKLGYKNPFIYPKVKRTHKKKSIKGNVKWQCMICSEAHSNKKKLLEHYECHKSNSEREKLAFINAKWQCMICSEVRINKDDLLKHYEIHKTETVKGSESRGDYYMCPVCYADFTSLTSYENHVELKHGENQSICERCNRSFKNLYSLCIHNFNKHTSDKMYRCTCCDFKHDEAIELRDHIKTDHEEYLCEICNRSFSSESWFEEHKNFHKDATAFQCELCLQNFQYSRHLVAHKKQNHSEVFGDFSVTHQCKYCSKTFAHKKSLVSHLRSHTGQSSVLCDLCGKSLSCPDHLKKHLRIHSGDKPHICSICGKGFSDKSNLKLHDRVHSGEKPHVCNVCNKGFSQRSSLVIHGRLHSGERPYRCELCHKGFVAKGLLGVHLKTCNGTMRNS